MSHSHTESKSAAIERIKRGAAECGIPAYMVEGLVNYFVHRVASGGFLMAVVENDLMRALDRADAANSTCLRAYGRFLYNYVPIGSYGSRENVAAWLHHPTDDPKSL